MQLSEKNRYLQMSVFLMLGLSLFVAGFLFYMVGSNQKMFDSKYSIYMFLPNVEQLNSGAFVTLSGLKVGVVGAMKFTTRAGQHGILIELKIDRNYASQITSSSAATVKTMGILGDKYIDISLGKTNDSSIPPGDFIQGDPGIDANSLIASGNLVLLELEKNLRNARLLTDHLLNGSGVLGKLVVDQESGADLIAILNHLNTLISKTSRGENAAGQFLQDTIFFNHLNALAENSATLSGNIIAGKGNLGQLLADTTLFNRIRSITMQTDSLLEDLHGDNNMGKLLKDKELYEELLQLSRTLNALGRDLQENPKRYLSFELF